MPSGIYDRSKLKLNTGLFKRGIIPWNKGIKTGIVPRSAFKKGLSGGVNSVNWKGGKPKCKICGVEVSYTFSRCLSCVAKTKIGEKNQNWKGDKVGYWGVHSWIRKTLGKPEYCQNANCIYPKKSSRGILLKPKRYEWANKSGKYLRDRSDWIRLCPSCHRNYDLKKITSYL